MSTRSCRLRIWDYRYQREALSALPGCRCRNQAYNMTLEFIELSGQVVWPEAVLLFTTDSRGASFSMANIQELSESSFETEVLSSAKPVLVDFWAPWCGPCRRIAPLLEQFALENAEAVKVVKVNTDEI